MAEETTIKTPEAQPEGETIQTQPVKESNPLNDVNADDVNDLLAEVLKELEEEEKVKQETIKKEQLKAVAKELLKKQSSNDDITSKTKEELEATKLELEEQKKKLDELSKQSRGSKLIAGNNPLDTTNNEQTVGLKDIEKLSRDARDYRTYRNKLEHQDFSKHTDFVHNYIKTKLKIRG